MYADAAVRQVVGRVRNVIMPVFQDILMLNAAGNWTSSLDGQGWFSVAVSQNSTALLVGDTVFRGRDGPHFVHRERMTMWVGNQPVTVLDVMDDVRDVLAGLQSDWYDATAAQWSQEPVDGVLFVFPSYSASCVDAVTLIDSCRDATSSRKPITVENVGEGAVSCPPHCPGTHGDGVHYTKECAGYLHGSDCLSAVNASLCAYGSGDHCVKCPVGAICPGGFRMW